MSMGLTEQQKRWNESVEEAWKKRNKKGINYNKTLISNPTISDLYDELRERILQISEGDIIIVEKSNYISFKVKKNNQNFVDVQLQKSVIKCVINLKRGKLKSNLQLRDISKIGHLEDSYMKEIDNLLKILLKLS